MALMLRASTRWRSGIEGTGRSGNQNSVIPREVDCERNCDICANRRSETEKEMGRSHGRDDKSSICSPLYFITLRKRVSDVLKNSDYLVSLSESLATVYVTDCRQRAHVVVTRLSHAWTMPASCEMAANRITRFQNPTQPYMTSPNR